MLTEVADEAQGDTDAVGIVRVHFYVAGGVGRIDLAGPAWTGGSTYLHREAPIYWGGPGVETHAFNYVITVDQPNLPEVVARDPVEPGTVLVRLGFNACAGAGGYPWRLP